MAGVENWLEMSVAHKKHNYKGLLPGIGTFVTVKSKDEIRRIKDENDVVSFTTNGGKKSCLLFTDTMDNTLCGNTAMVIDSIPEEGIFLVRTSPDSPCVWWLCTECIEW